MLMELYVENVALIDKLRLEFGPGLSVLTGETGAGKSILIDSIGFVLGDRASREIVRVGEQGCLVEAFFAAETDACMKNLAEMGVDTGEDASVMLSRSLTADGKTVCRVNGRVVALSMLREISSVLMDICGQHQQRSLMDPQKHIELLDGFCDVRVAEIKKTLRAACAEYGEIVSAMNSISGDETERASKIELYEYQAAELGAAKLRQGEEQELNDRKHMLNNCEKLFTHASKALELLDEAPDGELPAYDRLSKAVSSLRAISLIDEGGETMCEKAEEALELVADVSDRLRSFLEELDADPGELDKIEARLDVLYNLKRKYSVPSADALPGLLERIREKLDFIVNSEKEIALLKAKSDKLEAEIIKLCDALHEKRLEAADKITQRITLALAEMNMKNVDFEVGFEKGGFGANGYDRVEFLISPNAGEPLKPLTKIASGGEASRIMLALKAVLSEMEDIESFIFDEIDSGISGRAAQKVAEKLFSISKRHQVLCVSHLPQLAAMADAHYYIEKKIMDGRTFTRVELLEGENSIPEIARLTSGARITEVSLAAAREMKLLSSAIKKEI